MRPLAAVERFLERLFERGTARLFRTSVRPVQIQRRLERAMEANRLRDAGRTIVPHRFVVRLSESDLQAARGAMPDLAAALANGALAFARAHGYTLLDRPVVTLRVDTAVAAGDIVIAAADPYLAPASEPAGVPLRTSGAPDPAGAALAADDEPGETALGQAPQHTAVFVVPGIEGPRATIREIRPDRSSRTIEFDGRPITIGRAPDNSLVVRDGRASRHHARIDTRRGALVLTDLGSTNGSFVNDRRVDSVALGEGDRIRVGTTSLIVEALVGAAGPGSGHGTGDSDAEGAGPDGFEPADDDVQVAGGRDAIGS